MKFLAIIACLAFVLTVNASPIHDRVVPETENRPLPTDLLDSNDQNRNLLYDPKTTLKPDLKADEELRLFEGGISLVPSHSESPEDKNLKPSSGQDDGKYAVPALLSFSVINLIGKSLSDVVGGIKTGLNEITRALDLIAAL